MEGYRWHFDNTVLTVWSAPNYCYRCGNVAAILELNENLQQNFTIFEAAPKESRGVPSKIPQPDYFLWQQLNPCLLPRARCLTPSRSAADALSSLFCTKFYCLNIVSIFSLSLSLPLSLCVVLVSLTHLIILYTSSHVCLCMCMNSVSNILVFISAM